MEAATRLARDCFAGHLLRWGSVVGHRFTPPSTDGSPRVRTGERVLIARTNRVQHAALDSGFRAAASMQWVPRMRLDDVLQEPHGDTTATLVAGYLEGWLPDGPITLY